MAKKNTPLPKPKGTDGNGNISVTGGPKVLDLGDFDDIFGPLESDTTKASPMGEFYKGMKDSFKERFKTKDIVRNFLRSAAPDGISDTMGVANEAINATRDIKESLERTNPGDLQYIAKKAQALLPKLKDYVSDKTYNKVSQGLEDKIDEYDYTISSNRDQTAIRRATQDRNDETLIKSALDNIALTEKVNHNRSEQAANTRHQQNRAENSIRDVLKTKRFDYMARSMGMAVDGINRIAGYQEQVNYNFQRKGLELQFRSYLGMKELIKLSEAQLELNARAFNAIVRNTALADHTKSNTPGLTEIGGGASRGSFVSRIAGKVAPRTLNNFLGNYGNESQSRITQSIGQKLSMAAAAGKMAGMGGNLWDQKYNLAGQFAGDALGDFLMRDIIPQVGRSARPYLTNMSNRFGGRHNQAGYYANNIPAFLQEFVNNGQNQHGIRGGIRDLIAPFVPQFGLQDKLKNGTFQTIDQHAAFNQMTQRSIVDGIPGYLARILQEIRMVRTGSNAVAREVYDAVSGKFTTESTSHESLLNKVIPKSAIRSASTTINDSLNTMDADNQLSPQARKVLSERLLRDASTNKRFDPEAYARGRGYAKGTDPETTRELEQFFKGKFQFDDKGRMVDNADNHQLRQDFSKTFLDIRDVAKDPIKEIERLINSGHTEPLRAMGIIITDEQGERINYDRIWEILRSGVTDKNPYGVGGDGHDPYRDDMSGTKGHRDFMGPVHPGMTQAFIKNRFNRYSPEVQAARDKTAQSLRSLRSRAGDLKDQLSDAYESGVDGVDELVNSKSAQQRKKAMRRYGKLLQKHFSNKINDLTEGTKPSELVDQLVNKRDQASGYVASGMEQLTDLYSSFDPTTPIIKGVDFGMGDLIDVNTKKIITSPKDITGAVINTMGQTVATAAEVAQGLRSPTGEIIVKVKDQLSGLINSAIDRFKGTRSTTATGGESVDAGNRTEDNSADQDWALGPDEDPVITARGLNSGEYRDAKGKVINSLNDIAGDVYNRSGNLVLSAKEFVNGLWSKRTGKKWISNKGIQAILKYGQFVSKHAGRTTSSLIGSGLKFAGKAALGLASKAYNAVVSNQNAYLPGEDEPVITRRALKNGEYYDKNGKPVEDFVNVYYALKNAQGENVIEPDQYKQLVNFDGSKHILAKNSGLWAKLVKRPMRFLKNQYVKASKAYYRGLGRATKKVGGYIGRKLFGGLAKRGGTIIDRFRGVSENPDTQAQIDATLTASDQQLDALHAIQEAIESLKPKELRKGSWQEQAARKAGIPNPLTGKPSNDQDSKDGLFKRGLKGLAGMLGIGKKSEEEDDGFGLSDAADVADIADSVRGRGGEKAAKKGGRLARWGGKLKGLGSKFMGTGIGKFLGTGAGKIATGIAGSALGTAAISAAGAVGTAAAGAASAIAGVLTAPVLLGAAAVAGVAAGGYWLYSRHRDSHGEFRSLRMEQYGISSTSDRLKVIQMETMLEKSVDKSSDVPEFKLTGDDAKNLLSVMDIDLDDKANVLNFAGWLEKRFKPIFIAWLSGLKKIGQPDVSINDVDDKVPDGLKVDFLDAIKFPYNSTSPYAVLQNPFDLDSPLEDNMAKISSMFDELREEYTGAKKDKEAKDQEVAKTPGDTQSKAGDVAKTAGAVGAAAATGNAALSLAKAGEADKLKNASVMSTPLAKAAVTASSLSGTIANLNERIGNTLTALQSIRMRAYGLQVLHLSDVKALLALEAVYAKDLTAVDDVVDYNGDEGKLLTEAGRILGKDTSVGSNDRLPLYNWLTQRFAPAFRAYYGMAKSLSPSAELNGLESKLSGADKVTVGNAVLGAIWRHDTTVWEVPSIFQVDGPLEDLKRLADADLEQLKKDSEKEVVDSPTQKGSDQMAGKNAAQTGGSFADKVVGTIKDTWNNAKETISTGWTKAKNATQDTYASAKMAIGMGPDYGEGGAQGGTIQSGGNRGDVVSGTGGQWESIPYPSASGSIKAAYPTLKAVSEMTGVPLDWLLAICGLESGFRYTVKAGTSSASGWFQFIDSTWDEMIRQYGSQFGLPPDPSRKLRNDPRANALMGAEFTKSNYEKLKKALGRDDLTDTDVYMAHFLGAGGAIKFLKADPNAMAYKIFQKEYSSNMPLFFVDSRPSQPRTIAQMYKLFQDKIAKFWATVGKGYKTGDDAGSTVQPQAPGSEQTTQVNEDEAVKAKLADDAKSKDGLAADASGGRSEDVPNADGTAPSTPTVSSLARGTAPMPGAPASGGGGSSSVSATGSDSGGSVVDAQQQAQLDAAQAQNNRRAAEVQRDQQATNDVSDIANKQLVTLGDIRELLKSIDSKIGISSGGGDTAGTRGDSSSGNNMNQSTMRNSPAAQRSSSVTLR